MSDYLIKQIESLANIDVWLTTEIVDALGAHRLEGLVLRNTSSGIRQEVAAAALFILIGASPHTQWLPASIARDAQGFILTGRDAANASEIPSYLPALLETSLPGIFAVGDVRARSVKRVASAVGEGSIAIMMVHEYFSEQREP